MGLIKDVPNPEDQGHKRDQVRVVGKTKALTLLSSPMERDGEGGGMVKGREGKTIPLKKSTHRHRHPSVSFMRLTDGRGSLMKKTMARSWKKKAKSLS